MGLPGVLQRASIVFDDPVVNRVDAGAQVPQAAAKHVELHGRIAEGSPTDRPVIETARRISAAVSRTCIRCLRSRLTPISGPWSAACATLAPKPWPVRFREIQAAGGHVEIVQSRIQQGEFIAVATGSLGLSPGGSLDGELQMTVAGLEKIVPALGIDKMLEQGVPQATLDRVAPGVRSQDINNLVGALDRAIPGLGKVVKQNANVGVAVGINALGKEAVLEGRKARTFPLRFSDGAVFFGPLKVAQIPPLF